MALKECGSHHSHSSRRRIIWPMIIFLFVIFLVILLTWAILKPSKPRFILQDATVFNFNVSGNPPYLLTSNFQITLSSRNPNGIVGIYYDRLDVYASYQSQQITFPTKIPSTYQGHKDINIWSPFVGGSYVAVAPYNALSLDQDKTRGAVMLVIRLDGQVRWKIGAFTTGKYHLHVRCPAYIVGDNAVKYTLGNTCNVTI